MNSKQLMVEIWQLLLIILVSYQPLRYYGLIILKWKKSSYIQILFSSFEVIFRASKGIKLSRLRHSKFLF